MRSAIGPDAARYLLAGDGHRVVAPFNVRWLLPTVCRTSTRRWWVVWFASWPLLASGAALWARLSGFDWVQAAAVAVLVVALPGVLQPVSTHPVGVDLPAMALSMWSAVCFAAGQPIVGLAVAVVAVGVKEQAAVWVALWAWSPLPLLALAAVAAAYVVRRPALDRVTSSNPTLRAVHEHPVRSAFEHRSRAGGWRNAWLMVAPWSVTLAALYHGGDAQLWAALAVGYGSLLVATDTVRIYQPPAAPLMCAGAVAVIPSAWLPLAVLAAVFWWREPVTG